MMHHSAVHGNNNHHITFHRYNLFMSIPMLVNNLHDALVIHFEMIVVSPQQITSLTCRYVRVSSDSNTKPPGGVLIAPLIHTVKQATFSVLVFGKQFKNYAH